MTLRKKIISFAALMIVALATLWFALTPREPEYQGKKLGQWLAQVTNSTINFNGNGTIEFYPTPPNEVTRAVLAMGTNSLPFVWRNLTAKDSPARQRVITWLNRQPFPALQLTPASTRQYRALVALAILGTNAAPLAPNLIQLLGDREQTIEAQTLLHLFGPAAFPALREALGSIDPWTRFHAAHVLSQLNPGTRSPITFIRLFNDTRDSAARRHLQAAAAQTNDLTLAKAARDVLESFPPNNAAKPTP